MMARMRVSRSTVAWSAIFLGLLAALVLWQLRGSDALPPDRTDDALQQAAAAGTMRAFAPDVAPEVPAAATGEDVIGLCERIFDDAVKVVPVEQGERDEESLFAELSNVQRKLAGTRRPDHYLTVLLLDGGVVNNHSVHTNLSDLGARAAESGSPLLAWHALRACVTAKEHCPYVHLEQRLLEADGSNAESWALVAQLRHRRGDTAGALSAMLGAAQAPTSTWYWTETIAALERTLAAETEFPLPLRVTTAIGSASAALPISPHQMCKTESVASRAWAESCLAFGELQASHNETILARGMSFYIREDALKALGDAEGAAQIAGGRAMHDIELHALASVPVSAHNLQSALIGTNPARLADYLEAVQELGEFAGAREFMRQQLPPLMERAGLLEREGARECAAQLFDAPVAAGSRAATAGHRIQVADSLWISVRGGYSNRALTQVRPDGTITLRRGVDIVAAGKTVSDLEREIAAALPGRNQPVEAIVIPLVTRKPEDLRRESDNALRP